MKINHIPLSDIKPYEHSPHTLVKEEIDNVAESLRVHGFHKPLVVNESGVIIAGHAVWAAAKKLAADKTPIPGARAPGAAPCFVVQNSTEAEDAARRIADNRIGIHNKFNIPLLAREAAKAGAYFTALKARETALINQLAPTTTEVNKKLDKIRASDTPLPYYGGKKTLAPVIAEIIEKTDFGKYIEPFDGSAAVALAAPKLQNTPGILNDADDNIANFWLVVQSPDKHAALAAELDKYGIHAETFHTRAQTILQNGGGEIERAWAVAYASFTSLWNSMASSYSLAPDSAPDSLQRRIAALKNFSSARLTKWHITRRDAVKLIQKHGDETALVYCDPPYINTSHADVAQEYAAKYTEEQYAELLAALAVTPAKFMLSTFENPPTEQFRRKYKWNLLRIRRSSGAAASSTSTSGKSSAIFPKNAAIHADREEWLLSNFPFPKNICPPAKNKNGT